MAQDASRPPRPDAAASEFFTHVEATRLNSCPEGQQVALLERTAPARCMAPLHRRGEEESYRVVEGEVTFFIGADRISAVEGDVVVAPAGAARTFRVGSQRARWLVLTTVCSLSRFEDFGRAVCRAPEGSAPAAWLESPEAAQITAIGWVNGIEVLGPPGMLPHGA